jgi:hypothetical protein
MGSLKSASPAAAVDARRAAVFTVSPSAVKSTTPCDDVADEGDTGIDRDA